MSSMIYASVRKGECSNALNTDPLLEAPQLGGRQRVGLADDGYDIDARRKAAHELNVHLAKTANKSQHICYSHAEHTYEWPVGGMK